MNHTEIEQTVNSFLVDDLEIDAAKLQSQARLREDLGIDSLDVVDIVVLVKEHFGFKMKTEEMTEVVTLGQFYDYIAQKLG
jgi:acyl carrier protein